MKLFEEAKQLLAELQATQYFLEKATLKARVLRQGEYAFMGWNAPSSLAASWMTRYPSHGRSTLFPTGSSASCG